MTLYGLNVMIGWKNTKKKTNEQMFVCPLVKPIIVIIGLGKGQKNVL